MIFSALVSFLGGSAFRMIWGEVAAFFKQKQEHAQEIERMRLQNQLEDMRHTRDLDRIRLQSELGVKEITVKGDIELEKAAADAFTEAMKNAARPTGIAWVDAWNGSIRPQYAEVALALWLFKVISQGFVMDEYDTTLLGVIAGFFFASRELTKRGK